MDVMEEAVSIDEGSPDSADEDTTDTQASQDPNGCKYRSKRKPSKTQIKHIAPKEENCDTSKYGTQNIDDLFNDVTQGIYRGTLFQLTTSQAQTLTSGSSIVTQAVQRQQKSNHVESTVKINPVLNRPSPSYPCGICGKIFRVPSRYDSHMLGHSKGKPFCCNTCGKMFSTEDKLEHHLPVHNTDRRASYTCESCGKSCVNWRAYLYHLKAKHSESGGKRFSCNICGRQFHTGQRLRNHMASHEIGKNHCCNVCGKLFESRKKLDVHVMVHNLTSKHDQHLQCSDCGRQYTEWIAFKQHMKTHGAEGVQYPCGLCEKIFHTQYEKEKHKRVHKQVQCEFCERFFRSASVLSVHLRIHTGERPYKCGLCERDFSQASVLKVHMRTHRKEGRYDCKRCGKFFNEVMEFFKHHMGHLEEGNLQCEECGKMFENINNKNRHMAAHRDRAGRICHICGKEFGRMSHLEAHMICHSNQLPLLCKVCGKMFPNEEALTTHYVNHVAGDKISNSQIPASKGPLFCDLCGKMFKGQVFLKNHMKKHELEGLGGVVPDEDVVEVDGGEFVCADCGKAFGHKHHLNVHRREHTGERPHNCILCGERFTVRNQLLEHISEHKKSGVMIYTNQEGGLPSSAEKNNHCKASKIIYQDSESGSDTETDHEGSEPTKTNVHQNLKYEPRSFPSISTPSQNHTSNKDETYLQQINNTYSNQSFPAMPTNSYLHKPYMHIPDQYNQKNYSQVKCSPYGDKNCATNQTDSFCDNKHFASSLGSIVNLNDAYNKKPFSLDHNILSEQKIYLENTNPSCTNKSFTNTSHTNSEENLSIKRNHSPGSSRDVSMPHYTISKSHYNLSPVSSNQVLSNNSISLQQSNTSNNAYRPQDVQCNLSGPISSSISMFRPEAHISTGLHVHPIHEYKHDMGSYTFPYNKSYMTTSRGTFQGGFYSLQNRFHSDQHLSSFQLLPQTAFPENSQQS